MDQKETGLSEESTPIAERPAAQGNDKRGRWRGYHTLAAAIITVGALVFTYAGATAASTVVREDENNPLVAQLVTVADVSYLVTDQGALYSQGLNNNGQLGIGSLENSEDWERVVFPVEGDQPLIEKVSSYGEHAIALDADGGLWTWGDPQNGALGSSQKNPFITPTRLNVSYSLAQISTGDDFAVALDARGKLHVWGQNGSGQLGTGDTEPREGPTLIMEDRVFNNVGAGADFAFAVENNGALWAWGSNDSGQFGNGTKDSSNVPVLVSEGGWRAVFPSRFSDTVLAINVDGVLHSWGPGNEALLGNNRDWRGEQAAENKRVEDEKARIKAEDDARRAALVKSYQDAALAELVAVWDTDHKIWENAKLAWELSNPEPKLEDFVTPTPPGATPAPIAPEEQEAYEKALAKWNDDRNKWNSANPEPQRPTTIPQEKIDEIEAKVTAEFEFTDTSGLKPAVIKEPKISGESLTPVAIATGARFVKASIGSENAFAIDSEGRLWAWGNDKNGQTGLGLDEDTHTHAPVKLSDAKFNDVFAGPAWAVAAANNGLYTWGTNDSVNRLLSAEKKLLAPTAVDGQAFTHVSGSISTAVASRSDGSSYSWGENIGGLTGQGNEEPVNGFAPIEGNFQRISFSKNGVLGLSQNAGYIFFWGSDRDRISSGAAVKADVLSPTRQVISSFKDVAAGRLSTHVVDGNGFVWTWGLSWMGNIAGAATAIPSPTLIPIDARIEKIAAAQTNVALLTDTNRVLWWGSDSPEFKVTELSAPEGEEFGTIAQLAAGKRHFLLREEDGRVWSFATINAQPSLRMVELPGAASFVAAGGESNAAIVDGVAYGWGDNSNGQLLSGGEANYWEPVELHAPLTGKWRDIAVSSTHSLASTADGVLYGWGLSDYIGGFSMPVDSPIHIKIANER